MESEFSTLHEIISENEMKKEELEKKYNQEVQNLISEMFQECVGGIKKLEEKIEERNDKWKETDEKVKLYLNLKQNLKQMMFFKAGRKGF